MIWQYINSKSKTRSGIGDLAIEPDDPKSDLTNDNAAKAEILSNFFNRVVTREPDDEVPYIPPKEIHQNMLPLIITENTVAKLLRILKVDKSPGPDQMQPKYLSLIAPTIAKPLAKIFQKSIEDRALPRAWKRARVSAIYKKGKKSHPGNYRPVSLTSIICKVMESLVREHIIKFMQDNKLFSSNQYDFITGRSTVLQLLTVLDKWTEALDRGLTIDCIYIDFQKAFDTVPHKRLIRKLRSYGITEDIIGWIQSFTTGRIQQVVVGNECSSWTPVTSGIPQGSVLGPLLFVIYINDLPNSVCSEAFLFADDTKIFRIIESENDRQELQKDLEKMMDWSAKWLLTFHPDKCKHMHITRNVNEIAERTYSLSPHQKLEVIREEKDIGVYIDHNLSFDKHISAICNKANSMFAVLRRSFQFIDKETFVPLYKTLVRTHLDYASPVYNPYKVKHIEQLEAVQRRATQQIPGMKGKSYCKRLRALNLPTLSYRRIRGDMIEIYKIIKEIYDSNATKFIKLWKDMAQRQGPSGNPNKMFTQRAKYNIRKLSFAPRTAAMWNSLPKEVANAPTVNIFKNRLDKLCDKEDIRFEYRAEISMGYRAPDEEFGIEDC